MSEVILSAKGLSKAFNGTQVLRDVDLNIYEGDFTVIMGASGSGKSTLLYCLSGMDKPSGGTLHYREKDMTHASEKELTALRGSDFGFVFQRTHLVSNLTLYENVVLAGYLRGLPQSDAHRWATELLERMGLTDAGTRLSAQVSGGEGQRAAVARAVIGQPSLLFADEPTGALNKANTAEVLDLLTALNKGGQSIMMVTHDAQAALRGNRVLYLEDGAVIAELELPAYSGKDKEREEKLSRWLEGLRW